MGLLPERRLSWRSFALGYGGLSVVIVFLLLIGLLFPEQAKLVQYHLTPLIALRPYEPPKPPQVKHIMPKLPPPPPTPAPVFQAKLLVPQELRKPHEQEAQAPKLDNFPQRVIPNLPPQHGALPSVVHTGNFEGSSVTPTINKPIEKVQTGGFGDPNGLAASANSKPGARLVAAQLGSFDMPVGPGQGNGSGGAKGAKGTVASAGFGQGIAQPGQGDGRSSGRGSIQTGGFGAIQNAAPTGPHIQQDVPRNTPVEILFKPNPVYSDEARQLKLEGEVLLEVLFTADGHLQVGRIVRGLGHGLDEAAVNAANKIRFKPATRNGQAVDSTAVVHVVFQLAY
jgi:TonB family protein